MEPDQAAGGLAESEPEGQRLVGIDAMDPQHGERIRGDDGQRETEALQRSAPGRHIAGPVEVVATSEQQREDDHRRERSVVDAVQDMQRGRERSDPDCHLPGPMPPPHETPSRRRATPRMRRHRAHGRTGPTASGVKSCTQSHVRRPGSTACRRLSSAPTRDDEPDDDSGARAPPADGEHGGAESDDHRGQIDRRAGGRRRRTRLAPRSVARRRPRRRSADTSTGADRRREEERGGKTLDRRPTRIEPERQRQRPPRPAQTRAATPTHGGRARRAATRAGSAGRAASGCTRYSHPLAARPRRRGAAAARRAYAPRSLRDMAINARPALPRQMPQLWPPRTTK